MNILILHEYKPTSANYIIALRLIEEWKKLGVNVSSFYYYNDFNSDNCQENIWNDSVQSIHSRYYLFKRERNSWYDKNYGKKLIYFITHPKFLFSYLAFKIDNRSVFKKGRRKLKDYYSNNRIDCIIGISAPHEIEKVIADLDVVVPRFLIRFDPYAFNPCFPAEGFNKRIEEEKRILSGIDKMFTTKLIIRDLLDKVTLNQYAEKMMPIEFPVISEEDQHPIIKTDKKHIFEKNTNNVYLLHAGSFYEDIRNPKKLVDFMKELPDNYILLVAGNNTSDIHVYDSEIRDRVIDLGSIGREDVKQVIDDCDFLISYNNLNTNMVPSKLFECIDSGKPFINLCQTDQCPTIEYVKDYDMAFTVVVGHPLPKRELIIFFENTKGCKKSRIDILSRYENCSVRFVAKQIYDEMNLVDR